MSSLLNSQGRDFILNIKNKIKDGFSNNKKEGFYSGGILGENAQMNNTINRETEITGKKVSSLNSNISNYNGSYKVLKEKTEDYLNNQTNVDMKKNYNVFINRTLNQSEINPTNIKGCVLKSNLLSGSTDFSSTDSNAFDSAYPANFTNFNDAKNACKLWAADNSKKYFAVSIDNTTNPYKFKCNVANTLPSTVNQYAKEKKLYTVLSNDNVNVNAGGLFNNGQIGIFNNSKINEFKTQTNVIDINNMKTPLLVTIFKKLTSNYTEAEKAMSNYPSIVRNPSNNGWWYDWGANKYPNDKAWWITTENIYKTGIMGYFYYLYYSPATITNAELYYVADDGPTIVKVNGKRMTENFTQGITLNAGRNIIEVELTNTGGPGAFVLYVAKPKATGTDKEVLVRSGIEGWGYMDNKVTDISNITNSKINQIDVTDTTNPQYIKTLNTVPAGYDKCDRFFGGYLNKNTINASFGRNCSNTTFEPINIRKIVITPNSLNEHIQISQLVVKAFVNGNNINVASRGKTTSNGSWDNLNSKNIPIDGQAMIRSYPNIYHTLNGNPAPSFWELDLLQDYQVTEIIYYNRADCCKERAMGMRMTLSTNNGTVYQPIVFPNITKDIYNFPINISTVSIA